MCDKRVGTTVNAKPTCVPEKKPKLIIIPKQDQYLLSKYGYNLHIKYEERIKILKKALKDLDELKVLRYINALRTLHKSNEKYYNKLNKDLKWIQSDYQKHK